ncbi:MAG: hypothetical protein PQJ60_14635 [Spirochaetales bacterium]|nr:hypothetical protein [Spirochaetales bacterium]
MPIKRCVTGLILLMIFLPLGAQEETGPVGETKKLEWAAVEGASSYLVEIEKGGVIIHTIPTEEPFLPLFLNPGEYRVRISVFNKFEKLASRSDWNPLTIYPSPQPIIQEYEPDFFYDDLTQITITIRGKDFDGGADFFLIRGNDRVRGEVRERREEERIICTVLFSDNRLPEVGLWDLAVINPSGKQFLRESAIRFGPRTNPIILSLTPNQLYQGENPGEIVIRGENFSGEARLIFEGPSPVSYSHLEIYYGEEITFLLNTEEMALGSYLVYVENEGHVRSNGYPLILEERPLNRAEKIQQERESEEGPAFFLGVEYHGAFPMGDSSDLFDNSWAGGALTFRKKFKNAGVYKIPLLRETGFFLEYRYTRYTDTITDYLTLHQQQIEGGLFYLSDWEIPFNLYAGLGFGASYSLFAFEEESNETSFDLSNQFALAMQFHIKGINLELGNRISFTHFSYNTMTAAQLYLLAGRNW